MLAVARSVLERNGGAPLSSSRLPVGVGAVGAITFASDASGNDGVGGFAFVEGVPNTVFVVHDPWPGEILRALLRALRPPPPRSDTALICSQYRQRRRSASWTSP